MTPAEAQRLQADARARGDWLWWWIERRGNRYVAWAAIPSASGLERLGEMSADTLDELRAMLPAGLTRHERTSVMSEGVVETWD